jgi:hypothetical protein
MLLHNAKLFNRTVSMNPLDYVLENLNRSREQVIAHPEWFQPDSLERIDRAIVRTQEIRAARAA